MLKELLIAMLIVTGVSSYSFEMQTQVKEIEKNVPRAEKPELNDNIEYPIDRLGITVVEIRPYDNSKVELIYKAMEVEAVIKTGINTNLNYPFEKGKFKYKLKKVLISKELINKLHAKAEELGIEILTETNAYELITKDNVVTGVKAKIKTGELMVNSKSVVLTTGGFGANKKMLYDNDKEIDDKILSTNSAGSTGDGIKMAQAIGADVVDLDKIQLYPVCDVETGKLLYTGDTRLVGGAILVNKEGKRFVEELGTRREISMGIKAQTDSVAYQIWDEESMKKSNILPTHEVEYNNLIEGKKLCKVNSIDEMADFFELDKENLKATINKFNEDSENGKDTLFNLRRLGFKIDKAPFYCLKAVPAVHHTMGGLKINKDANVLDKNGKIIKGLYAAGETTGGIHGNNRLGSVSITDITVFGIIAGTNAAKNK